MPARIVEVRKDVLKKNDVLARALRDRFAAAGTLVVSLVSSPGAGKTTLLERTLATMKETHRVVALVGDLQTDNDARRLAAAGVPVRQITTGTVCHLDAQMVDEALAGWDLANVDILFIENVGNLVCPAAYDLGENLRVVLLSVTEGEDKPSKYPAIFNSADLALITKIDLSRAAEFKRVAAHAAVQDVRPGIEVLEVSAKSGDGFAAWIGRVEERARMNAKPAGMESITSSLARKRSFGPR